MALIYDINTGTVKSKIFTPEIKERMAYQVGSRLYETKEAAASKQAWSWILEKYSNDISGIQRVLSMECNCSEDELEYQRPYESCPLHDRQYGYFRKLHRSIVSHILKQWNNKL